MKYIFDIDDTILKTKGHDYMGAVPIPGRIEFVNKLYDEGHYIMYYTARNTHTTKDWTAFTLWQLRHYGAKFHRLSTDKQHYDIWVDDKSMNSEDFFKKSY